MRAEDVDDFLGESGDEDGFGEVFQGMFEFAAVEKPDAVDKDPVFLRKEDALCEGGCGFVFVWDVFEEVVEHTLLVVVGGCTLDDLVVEVAEFLVGSGRIDLLSYIIAGD